MEGAGATVVGGEDAIFQEAPDEDAQDELKAMGKQLEKLINRKYKKHKTRMIIN